MKFAPACLSALAVTLLTMIPAVRGQTAGTFTTLDSFGPVDSTGANATGAYPYAALTQGSDGNFYGTTNRGGANAGTVFEITPGGVLTTLHTFGVQAKNHTNSDGDLSNAALLQGGDGNFYGTTAFGGSGNGGTIFSINPAGTFTLLHGFTGGADGADLSGSLVDGGDGSFYGAAQAGGANDNGTIYKIAPDGTLTVLYAFSATDSNNVNADGAFPSGNLIVGSDGNFYGTTNYGGVNGVGVLYRITPAGALATVYSFTPANDNSDNFNGGPVQGADGNFYGVTTVGGANGAGTIYQITPGGVLTTLHSFAAADSSTGINLDGAGPNALTLATDGNFYGITNGGGAGGAGAIFRGQPRRGLRGVVQLQRPGRQRHQQRRCWSPRGPDPGQRRQLLRHGRGRRRERHGHGVPLHPAAASGRDPVLLRDVRHARNGGQLHAHRQPRGRRRGRGLRRVRDRRRHGLRRD